MHGIAPSIVALSVAMLGLASMLGPFWAFATSFLGGIGAAAGIALVNSVGNIGGFVGPNIIGYVQRRRRASRMGSRHRRGPCLLADLLVLPMNAQTSLPSNDSGRSSRIRPRDAVPMTESRTMLEIRNLRKTFGSLVAVDDVSFARGCPDSWSACSARMAPERRRPSR